MGAEETGPPPRDVMAFRVPPPFRSAQEWALALATMAWGFSFLVIRAGLELCGPLFFVGLRFGTAAVLLLFLCLPTLRRMTRRELLGGLAIGLSVFGGFALQTAGLVSIPVAKSAFITAFYAPLVPVFEWLITRRRPGLASIIGLAITLPGVFLLTGAGQAAAGGLGMGELLTILCAVSFAIEVVCMGLFAPGSRVLHILLVEMALTAALAFAGMPLVGEPMPAVTPRLLIFIMGLGAASVLIQGVVLWAQKSVPPTRAAVIYASEPAWGGVAGWLAGERVGWVAIAGCALVLAGILVGTRGKRDARKGPAADGA